MKGMRNAECFATNSFAGKHLRKPRDRIAAARDDAFLHAVNARNLDLAADFRDAAADRGLGCEHRRHRAARR